MTIEFHKALWFVGLWFFPIPGESADYMGALWREADAKEPCPFTFRFRIRYHRDDKVWASEDRRSWHSYTVKSETAAGAEKKVREILTVTLLRLGRGVDDFTFLRWECDGETAMRKFREATENGTVNFASFRTGTKAQGEAYERGESVPGFVDDEKDRKRRRT